MICFPTWVTSAPNTFPHPTACLPLRRTQVRLPPKYLCQLGNPQRHADSGPTHPAEFHFPSGLFPDLCQISGRYPSTPCSLPASRKVCNNQGHGLTAFPSLMAPIKEGTTVPMSVVSSQDAMELEINKIIQHNSFCLQVIVIGKVSHFDLGALKKGISLLPACF